MADVEEQEAALVRASLARLEGRGGPCSVTDVEADFVTQLYDAVVLRRRTTGVAAHGVKSPPLLLDFVAAWRAERTRSRASGEPLFTQPQTPFFGVLDKLFACSAYDCAPLPAPKTKTLSTVAVGFVAPCDDVQLACVDSALCHHPSAS